jgi:hypothetical protein
MLLELELNYEKTVKPQSHVTCGSITVTSEPVLWYHIALSFGRIFKISGY